MGHSSSVWGSCVSGTALPPSFPPPRHPSIHLSNLSSPFSPSPPSSLPPFPSLLCGLVMAPVDKLVEQRLLASRPSSLPSSSSELEDPLLESMPSLAPSPLPSHLPSSLCGKARQQMKSFSAMFWTLALCCLVRKGGEEGGKKGGRGARGVELSRARPRVLIFSSFPFPLPLHLYLSPSRHLSLLNFSLSRHLSPSLSLHQAVYGTILPFNNIASSLLQVGKRRRLGMKARQ